MAKGSWSWARHQCPAASEAEPARRPPLPLPHPAPPPRSRRHQQQQCPGAPAAVCRAPLAHLAPPLLLAAAHTPSKQAREQARTRARETGCALPPSSHARGRRHARQQHRQSSAHRGLGVEQIQMQGRATLLQERPARAVPSAPSLAARLHTLAFTLAYAGGILQPLPGSGQPTRSACQLTARACSPPPARPRASSTDTVRTRAC